MKRQLSALVAAAVYLVSLSEVAAQTSYSAPSDAASDAAAERAIARLGQKRWLEIRASVRTIPMPTIAVTQSVFTQRARPERGQSTRRAAPG